MRTLSRIALISTLTLATAGPALADGLLFAPVPLAIQAARSGISLGAARLSQNFAETSNGATLDTETGTIGGYTLGVGTQWNYLGLHANYSDFKGNDTYNGSLQNLQTGALTPYQDASGNRMLDWSVQADLGFSPAPGLAVMPDVFAGRHIWYRSAGGVGGYEEDYYNDYQGIGLEVAYTVGSLVLAGSYQDGSTSGAYMDSYLGSGARFDLGSHSWQQAGVSLTWVPSLRWKVFASYTETRFGYGQSAPQAVQVNGSSYQFFEPDSTTREGVFSIGVKVF